jgi:hypothetical protein
MDDREILIEAWKQTIAVQMHFNDMAMKIRAFALTLIAAILTAQSFASLPMVWLPIVAALGCWSAFYLMDRWWYHYLLLGAVLHGSDLERQAAQLGLTLPPTNKFVASRPLLGVTGRISELNREGFPFAAKYKMDLYYLLVAIGIFLILPARIGFSFWQWVISLLVIFGLFVAWYVAARRGGGTPGFDHETGTFQNPEIIVSGGKLIHGTLPKQLKCGEAVYIYSSEIKVVDNCHGLGGPKDGQNATCQTADQGARKAAAKVTCPTECPVVIREVFRGWSCKLIDNKNYTSCAVELKVECPVTN